MLDFQQKRKVKSMLYHRTTLIILVILVLISFRSTWVIYQKKRESEKQMAISARTVQELTTRDAEIEAQIERIQTEGGVEAEIRSKFNVAKDKENIVVLLDDTPTTTVPLTKNSGFWYKITHLFSKK